MRMRAPCVITVEPPVIGSLTVTVKFHTVSMGGMLPATAL
jgi:hypothetical protein